MIHAIIVEDDPMVAQINQQYLQCAGDFVVDGVFQNGGEALVHLEQHPAELVILDMYMPGMSGNELLRQLRARQMKSEVIVVTAATEMRLVDEVLQLGIVDYLIKPYTFQRFQEAIHKYLAKNRLLRSSEVADQSVVDRLLSSEAAPGVGGGELRKGLTQQTLEYIQSLMGEGEAHTCESIAAASGLSKMTVRRYLNYLLEAGQLVSTVDYETGGRPRVLYRPK